MYISREKLFSASKNFKELRKETKQQAEKKSSSQTTRNKKELSNGGFQGKTLMPFVTV